MLFDTMQQSSISRAAAVADLLDQRQANLVEAVREPNLSHVRIQNSDDRSEHCARALALPPYQPPPGAFRRMGAVSIEPSSPRRPRFQSTR